ncbi:MAG TPA: 23S rRNA (uracil(1939)-C(5))-methyltransferase RlmD [Thiobacillaceae bacterium]|nr:23S rRNA (uracil(1939)-C(5))-methyltransferase RlmD [Thiobacillaceae bacterium]HNU64691.1 23S rRNA (uracil(1939)-C(5))-methyltransferase RlmD [Thiobacillaceae bacterium]
MDNSVVRIESLDHEGRGVAHLEGKAVFVDGALPGEVCEIARYSRKAHYERAQVVAIRQASPFRVTPACPWFGVCGGCSHQHLDESAQVAVKQRVLEDCLTHIGRVRPEGMLPPVHGHTWGYRARARLSVRNVPKKGGVLVGFHEKKSSYVADMLGCEVLPRRISDLLPRLRTLVAGLSIRDRLPQIELALGEDVDVLVLRILEALSPADEDRLRAFADAHRLQFWLQPRGPDTAYPFYPLDAPELSYRLPEFDLVMPFRPTDFTQVNHGINRMLIRRAVRLLDPRPGERIADFFCGLGNFSLPIARHGASVLGMEGSAALVARAADNARRNGLAQRTEFRVLDLFRMTPEAFATLGRFDKLLIDPPRDGAVELVKSLPRVGAPDRVVYVSCSPATLARDAAVLVHQQGYRLVGAGVANMFPHTAHVESIALFERP